MLICSSLLCLLSLSFFISPAFTSSVHFSQSTSSATSVFLSLSSSVHFSQSTSSAISVCLSLPHSPTLSLSLSHSPILSIYLFMYLSICSTAFSPSLSSLTHSLLSLLTLSSL